MNEIYNYFNIVFIVGAVAFSLTGGVIGYMIGVNQTAKICKQAILPVKNNIEDDSNRV